MKFAKSIPNKKELDYWRFKCAIDKCKKRFGYGHAGMYCRKHAKQFGGRK